MSTIEVIDTAIKIGLGVLLTACSTIVITFVNHRHENRKLKNIRYYDTIEQVRALIAKTTHVSLKYWAILSEWVKNNHSGKDLTTQRRNEFNNIKTELFNVFENMTDAESMLLLLGIEKTADLMRKYGNVIKEFTQECNYGDNNLTDEIMIAKREDILSARKDVYKHLSRNYKDGIS